MPHAAVIAAATVGTAAALGSAVAFEMMVFRPWREENWPNGIVAGVRQELHEIQQGLWELRNEAHLPSTPRSPTPESDQDLQAELDRFEMHERRLADIRADMMSEMGGPDQQLSRRHGYTHSQHQLDDSEPHSILFSSENNPLPEQLHVNTTHSPPNTFGLHDQHTDPDLSDTWTRLDTSDSEASTPWYPVSPISRVATP